MPTAPPRLPRTRRAATLMEIVAVLAVVAVLASGAVLATSAGRDAARALANTTQLHAVYVNGRALAAAAGAFPDDLPARVDRGTFTIVDGPSRNATELSVARHGTRVAAYVARHGRGCIGIVDNLDRPAGTWILDETTGDSVCSATIAAARHDELATVATDPRDPLPFDFDNAPPAAAAGLTASHPPGAGPHLEWEPSNGPNLAGYRILRDGAEIARVGAAQTSYDDTTAAAGTTYAYQVQAVNSHDVGYDPTPPVTLLTRPATPGDLTVTADTAANTVAWAAVPGVVSGYRVSVNGTQVADQTDVGYTHDTTSAVAYAHATEFAYSVVAYNATGPSDPATANTLSVPAAPAELHADALLTNVDLHWDAVTGADSYAVYRDGAHIATTAGPSYVDEGLTVGQTYTYTVRARNSGGESGPSPDAQATAYQLPGVVTGVTATPGDGQITLTWAQLANSPGQPVSGYRIYRNGIARAIVAGAGTTSFVDTAVTNGVPYTYQVAGYHKSSEGPLSGSATTAPYGPPPQVTGLSAASGVRQITLQWEPLTSTAANPVAGYEIHRNGTPLATVTGAHNATYTATGLADGATHTFRVRAYYGDGTGPFSAEVTASTYAPPDAPSGLSATAGAGQVTLNWAAPAADGGTPITGYQVTVTPATGVTGPTTRDSASTATSYIFTGLRDEVTYTFSVRALNAAGVSAGAATTTATPTAWSTWTSITATSDVAVASWGANRLDVVVRGPGNDALHRWTVDGGATWSAWGSLGGALSAAPAVVAPDYNRLAVFALGMDGHLYQQLWNGSSWSGWQLIATAPAGVTLTEITASTHSGSRVDVWARGADMHLYQAVSTSGGAAWAAWSDIGCCLTDQPAAASPSSSAYEVAGIGVDYSTAWRRTFSGGWGSWTSFGPQITQVGLTVSGTNRVTYVGRTTDGALAQLTIVPNSASVGSPATTLAAAPNVWVPPGGSYGAMSVAYGATSGKVDIFTVDANGRIRHLQRNA